MELDMGGTGSYDPLDYEDYDVDPGPNSSSTSNENQQRTALYRFVTGKYYLYNYR